MGFLSEEMPNLAVRLSDGSFVSLRTPGAHTLSLLDPNPNVTNVTRYMTMVLGFTTLEGPATATLTVLDPQYDSGFALVSVPEPGTALLLLVGLTAGWPLLRRKRICAGGTDRGLSVLRSNKRYLRRGGSA